MANNISINIERLTQVCQTASEAYKQGQGIYSDQRKFLPQWNLPQELEYNPQQVETKNPLEASKYLWTLASLERKSLSRVNIKNGLKTWNNPELRWIFNPLEVAVKNLDEVTNALKTAFHYTLNEFPKHYKENATRLTKAYETNSIKTIENKTVEEAREILMSFNGIGPGISNLFILYCHERGIVSPLDPENMRLKIDIHKARIPVNTGCISTNNQRVRRDLLVPLLEEDCLYICKTFKIDAITLDPALWVPGSEVCTKRNYKKCITKCSLERLCISCVPEDSRTSEFIVYDERGRRMETRKGAGQFYFDFMRPDSSE